MQQKEMLAMQSEVIRRALIDPYQYYEIEHSNKLYLFLRYLYVQSSGQFNIKLNHEIAKRRPIQGRLPLNEEETLFTFNECNNILNNLNNGGYAITEEMRSLRNDCDELRIALDKIPSESETSSRCFINGWKNLCAFNLAKKLCKDQSIKYIADNFLNCDSHLNSVLSWKTSFVPKENRNLSGDAQLFHFDSDHNRFLKIFIYLDEVERNNGPHVFIPYTSTNGRPNIAKELQRDGRISNIDIIKYGLVPQYIKGKKGTMIFGDTHNLHKGTPVSENSNRYIFQLQFVDSPFGADRGLSIPEIIELNNNL